MNNLLKPIFAVVALVSGWATVAHAEQFDTSFAGTGRKLEFSSRPVCRAIAMFERPGGALVTISDCGGPGYTVLSMTNLNANGTFDMNREGGIADFAGITGAAMDSRGRFVIIGTSTSNPTGMRNFRVQRLLGTGELDASFGNAGNATIDFSGFDDRANAVAIDADDNVVIVGEAGYSATDSDFGVVRLRGADGMLDTTFNGTGKTTVYFDLGSTSKFDRAYGLAIAASGGRITIVGTAFNNAPSVNHNMVAMARLNSNGTPDASFCNSSCATHGGFPTINNGRRVYYFGADSSDNHIAYGVALLGNGDFYIVGSTSSSYTLVTRPAIARISVSGDYVGEKVTNASTVINAYQSVQVSDATGQRVMVSGIAPGYLLLQAFTSDLGLVAGYGDCLLDSAFCIRGGGGVSDYQDFAGALNLDRSGRPLFAGAFVAAAGDNQKGLFARFTNDTGPKPDFIFHNGFQ